MSKHKVKEVNYFSFDHDAVNKRFEGNLTYIRHMCLNSGNTVAIYKAEKPNRTKGHKEYMLLSYGERGGLVSGMDLKEIKKHSKHDAVLCEECNTILYSLHVHHYHTCDCKNETMIDGGKDYCKYGGIDFSKVTTGKYDVISNRFMRDKKKEG